MGDDLELEGRLSSLEARIPGAEAPDVERGRRHVRLAGRSALAACFLLLLTAVATAGVAVVTRSDVRGFPGVENSGQPLNGENLECMTPKQAEAYLVGHGYSQIVWQIERDGLQSLQATAAPEHGYVVPGAIVDGVLLMIVDQRALGSGVGACYGMPMP